MKAGYHDQAKTNSPLGFCPAWRDWWGIRQVCARTAQVEGLTLECSWVFPVNFIHTHLSLTASLAHSKIEAKIFNNLWPACETIYSDACLTSELLNLVKTREKRGGREGGRMEGLVLLRRGWVRRTHCLKDWWTEGRDLRNEIHP